MRAAVELHLTPILTRQLLADVRVEHLPVGQLTGTVDHTGAVLRDLGDVALLLVDYFDFQF